MKILLYAIQFAGPGRTEWLLDDLAAGLARRGHEVDVVVFDTKAGRSSGRNRAPSNLFDIISVGPAKVRPGLFGKIGAFASTALRLRRHARLLPPGAYDRVIYSSIAMLSWGAPGIARRSLATRKLVLIHWDFFPIHNVEIGRIPRTPMTPLLRRLEARSMMSADVIAVMSPANERYLHSYFPEVDARIEILPPWASTPTPDPRLENDTFTIIFGGQLVAGRGVDTLLRAFSLFASARPNAKLIIAGDGPERPALQELADRLGLSETTFTGNLPRFAYRELLAKADLGIAITVPDVSPPSFPSKIVEYCGAGVPVIVCVEPSSDAHELVVEAGAGRAAHAGDEADLARSLAAFYEEWLAGDADVRRKAARMLFENKFSIEQAVRQIESF